jgi:hypothetical protein
VGVNHEIFWFHGAGISGAAQTKICYTTVWPAIFKRLSYSLPVPRMVCQVLLFPYTHRQLAGQISLMYTVEPLVCLHGIITCHHHNPDLPAPTP